MLSATAPSIHNIAIDGICIDCVHMRRRHHELWRLCLLKRRGRPICMNEGHFANFIFATIRVVGMDDWSWRRSWRYGTMIVDLERCSVVDILEDRSMPSVARRLEQHPSVEIVSRDRCGLYAQAAREGVPQARQAADRFHLMQNLRVAIEEQMSLSGRATGRALLPDKSIGRAQIDLIQDDPHVDATLRRRVRHAHRQSREAVFDTVHALNKEGLSYSEIARRAGYGRRSIAKWLTFEMPPNRQKSALKPTSPLYFEAFLAARWKDGNRCGRHLFHDIKQRGYTGSFSNLERLLASWRRPERSVKDSELAAPILSYQPGRDAAPIRDLDTVHVISPVVAAALCLKPRSLLSQAKRVDALKQGWPEFASMRSLAMSFRGIFRSRDPGKLDSWIDDAVNSGLVAIERSARVLHRDLDAVYNAIELPWSNGQAEGQINRLKTIKRAM